MFLMAQPGAADPSSAAHPAASTARPGDNPRALYLATGTVDLSQTDSLHADANVAFEPESHYVIQLDGPMSPARRAALVNTGIVPGEYIPMNAFVVKGNSLSTAVLKNHAFVRWVGVFENSWKLAPGITGAREYETDERRAVEAAGKKRVVIQLFRGADLAVALNRLSDAGAAVTDVQPLDDHARIEAELDVAAVDGLAQIPDVQFVDEAPEGLPRNSSCTWVAQSNVANSTPLWDHGLHGENQVIGLIDWGLDENHCSFDDDVPPGPSHRKLLDYVAAAGQTIPGSNGFHGTYVGCALAGSEISPTNPDLRGSAYNAKVVFQHYTGTITTINLNDRLTHAHNLGASVHSNSWGSTSVTSYSAWCADIDTFTRNNEDDLVIFAIINGSSASAPGSIRSPENAKNCIAVAATGDSPNQDQHASGARGPTNDGRQKPEVWIAGCPTSAAVSTECGITTWGCATSWSAPLLSAMATLTRQYFQEGFYPQGSANGANSFTPSGALLKAILANSARDMSGFAGYYGSHEGYGRVLMDDALYFSGDARKLIVHDLRNADGLSTGESEVFGVNVLSSSERLKVTLVWTDAPAFIGATFSPVNNLNLVVTDPVGTIYRGNVFSGAESMSGGPVDILNNTEQVHRSSPQTGLWTIEVSGAAVNSGTQGFALVITGDVEPVAVCLRGDMNDDDAVNGADITGFVDVLLNGGTPREQCAADVDESGNVDPGDVGPFTALLLGVAYCPRLQGDLNNDFLVNGGDLQGFTDVMLVGGTPEEQCAADLNYSGSVDFTDVEQLLSLLLEIS